MRTADVRSFSLDKRAYVNISFCKKKKNPVVFTVNTGNQLPAPLP